MNKNKTTIIHTGSYSGWVEPFVKAVLEKAKLSFKLVDIYDMDEERIYLNAEAWDEPQNNTISDEDDDYCYERELTIRYEKYDIDPWPAIHVEYNIYDTTCSKSVNLDSGVYKIVCYRGKTKLIDIDDTAL